MAQLDNAADSDSEDRGFESLRAGQIRIAVFSDPFSFAFFLAMLYNIADISLITPVCKAQRGDPILLFRKQAAIQLVCLLHLGLRGAGLKGYFT